VAGLALALVAAGCGTEQGGGAGAPAVGNTGVPMKLDTASLRNLVWSVPSIPPPAPLDDTLLPGLGALPKPLSNQECPVVDFMNHDPDAPGPFPDPLALVLVFEQADGGLCVAGDLTQQGEVEVTLSGVAGIAGGVFQRIPATDLVMRETYARWSREVPDGDGTRAVFFGGTRQVTVEQAAVGALGVTRIVTDPWVSRRTVFRDANGVAQSTRFHYYATTGLTVIPAPGLGGPGTALRRNGTVRVASDDSGYVDVALEQVLYDPAVCGGTPTGGRMTFRAAGQTLTAAFDLVYSDPLNCGYASFQRPGDDVPIAREFGTESPVF
jgi:hypothetical protein